MICFYCGRETSEDSGYCTECGAKIVYTYEDDDTDYDSRKDDEAESTGYYRFTFGGYMGEHSDSDSDSDYDYDDSD